MSEIGISPVSEKGQVTIPKEIRDTLKLSAGDRVIFIDKDDHVIIRKASTEKLSRVLENQKPWNVSALEFQKKIRKEWD